MDQLIEDLTPKSVELLDEYLDKRVILNAIMEEDSFIRGVRIGAQFILDVIGDYRSQLPQADEE